MPIISASLLLLSLLAGVLPAAAQEGVAPRDTLPARAAGAELPRAMAAEVIRLLNDSTTLRFEGEARIPAERVVRGDVVVLGGPLRLAGRVEGRVVVVNGDAELRPGASVTGALTVVGGELRGLDSARVGGEVARYGQRLHYRRAGSHIVEAPRTPRPGEPGDADERDGRAAFIVATGQSYNRVEGLPITFGPVLETGGANPLRFRANAIYRTEQGSTLSPEHWGYDIRLEQFLGGRRALRVGARAIDVIDPIEAWQLTKLENGLATFFLHTDYRDHYRRRGWSAYTTLTPRGAPLSLTAAYRDERNTSVAAGSPWTVYRNTDPWRPQPLVAEGTLRSVALSATWDGRAGAEEDPSTGWYAEAEVERGVDVDLSRPAALARATGPADEPITTLLPEQRFGSFSAATLDLRRYNRISPRSRLNLRLLAGGSLGGAALPPQRQHALGGEGSLPGYGLFALDCGARSARVIRASDAGDAGAPSFYPRYGCDRVALFQAEYRSTLRVALGHNDFRFGAEHAGDGASRDADPAERAAAEEPREPTTHDYAQFDVVAFFDAGRGWTRGAAGLDEPTAADVGLGLLFGRIGVYGAVPLRGDGGVNLFVRLAPRL